jgi:myo-inositol-1(or 4)-monophosphatase
VSLSPAAVRDYLEVAAAITEAAGPIALRHFRQPLEVADKSGGLAFDPVTSADREIEAFVRAELGRRFPDHGIVGEEGGTTAGTSRLRWLLDPIDGTRAFLSGMPAWGILLGLAEGDRPLAGVMHQPYLRETFLGTADGGWLRRDGATTPLRTRRRAGLADAILYCTDPAMFGSGREREAFARVGAACRMTRYGGDCYAYCLLALGQIDLVIEGGLAPYDIVPLIPIVEGAGGIVTGWDGGPAHKGGLVVAAANPTLHQRALALLGARAAAGRGEIS